MKTNYSFLFSTLIFFVVAFNSNAQTDNTFTGIGAGTTGTGNYNSGFGKDALSLNMGHSNSAFGNGTLRVTTGGSNCAFGNSALSGNTTGGFNCAIGTRSLSGNNIGSWNIGIGHRALENNVLGNKNTGIGYASLLYNVGNNNIALGYWTPRNLLSGDSNIFIGVETASGLLHGSNNVFLGKVYVNRVPSTTALAGNDTNGTIIFADGEGKQRIFVHNNGNTGIGLGNNVIPVNKLDVKGGVVIGGSYTPNGSNPASLTQNSASGAIVAPANGLLVEGRIGVGNTFPNNKVEITQGKNGNSGLRFTNLTSNYNPPTLQAGTKFLSVNATGDVVLQKLPPVTSTNSLVSSANLMTSNVNSIATAANIINSISNTINTNNQLVTTVNGVVSAPVNLPAQIQTLSQNENTITLSNGGGSFTIPSFVDTDAQALTLTGNNLSISNGNTVVLPTYTDVPQTISQSGNTVTLSNGGGSFTLPAFTDTDTDAQGLTLSGNNLSISNGNTVVLPTQTLNQAGNTVTLSNGGGSFTLPTFNDTDAQGLTLTGNNLSISNGNTVVLPTQTLNQSGNTVTLSNGGGSFTLPTFTDTDTDAQALTLTGNNLSISNGNTVVLPTFTDTSLYANNGVINQATTTSGNRVVDMNNSNIWFNTANSTSNGNIYLGSSSAFPNTTGNYKLFVEGGILTEKVKVALRSSANWADYVFADNYKLMPLSEVEKFVAVNKHLPGIESASELSKNGLDLAAMQSKQMEKIEELTLYIINQNKTIEQNQKEMEALKLQVQALIEKTK